MRFSSRHSLLISIVDYRVIENNRVLKLIEDIAKVQARTDKQIRSLINYNSNRDEELEILIEEAMVKKLKDAEWGSESKLNR